MSKFYCDAMYYVITTGYENYTPFWENNIQFREKLKKLTWQPWYYVSLLSTYTYNENGFLPWVLWKVCLSSVCYLFLSKVQFQVFFVFCKYINRLFFVEIRSRLTQFFQNKLKLLVSLLVQYGRSDAIFFIFPKLF